MQKSDSQWIDGQVVDKQTSQFEGNNQARVVIVGAGLAGLAAAQRLYQSGIHDVVILDGLSRIGGRVHTISYTGQDLELGAQWLHGAYDNPLYAWLIDKNMLEDFESGDLAFEGLFCTSQGRELDKHLVSRVLGIVCAIKESMSKNQPSQVRENSYSNAGDAFRLQLLEHVQREPDLMANKQLIDAIFDWFMRFECIENCTDHMEDVSLASYTDWSDAGDGSLLNFKFGYRSLLNWFCDQMPTEKMLSLERRVVNIEMLELDSNSKANSLTKRPILVHHTHSNFDYGSHETILETIECDHVIVTSSIGFLKANHRSLFKPPLPRTKRELIESIGFGTVNKIILEFERPFWNHLHGIKLIWQDEADKLQYPRWARDVLSFDVVRKQPNLLVGWIGGEGAHIMEAESDEEIGRVCVSLLEHFLPENYGVPTTLLRCFCTRWHRNPFTRGSYSYQSVKCRGRSVEKLHEPLYNQQSQELNTAKLVSPPGDRIPRVLFAGEATAGRLYSTAHGAIISGWREADRLIYLARGKTGANLQQSASTNLTEMLYHDL